MTPRTTAPSGRRFIRQTEAVLRLGRSEEWVRRQRDPVYPHRAPSFLTPYRTGRSVLTPAPPLVVPAGERLLPYRPAPQPTATAEPQGRHR